MSERLITKSRNSRIRDLRLGLRDYGSRLRTDRHAATDRPPRYRDRARARRCDRRSPPTRRREHLALEMLHEPLRHQLAQPVLAARPARALGRGRSRPPVALRSRNARSSSTQLGDALRRSSPRSYDRRPPLAGAVGMQRQVRLDRRHQPIGALAIRLVDDEDVGDLHDAGLERLHVVARAGHQRDDRRRRRCGRCRLRPGRRRPSR